MVDPNESEKAAMDFAAQAAGEFMEAQVTTDLAQLPPDVWFQLIEVIITAYVDDLLLQREYATQALARTAAA